jgi:hypothetical protein
MSPQPRTAKRQARELKLLAEYNAIHYPGATIYQQQRLGPIDAPPVTPAGSTLPKNFYGSLRRWADAVVILPDAVIIQEATIGADFGKISMLQLYARLASNTPELAPFRGRPVRLEIVCAVPDPALAEQCRSEGIAFSVFTPPWVLDYLSSIFPREGRARG